MKNGHEALLPGELTQLAPSDLAVRRGRDAAARIKDTVENYKARGRNVLRVNISEHVAQYLVAFFRSWSRYTGGYPTQVHGVDLRVVPGQIEDVEIVFAEPGPQ